MNRPLTKWELDICRVKLTNYFYSLSIVDGVVQLGYGEDIPNEDPKIWGYVPYEVLMNPAVVVVNKDHIIDLRNK